MLHAFIAQQTAVHGKTLRQSYTRIEIYRGLFQQSLDLIEHGIRRLIDPSFLLSAAQYFVSADGAEVSVVDRLFRHRQRNGGEGVADTKFGETTSVELGANIAKAGEIFHFGNVRGHSKRLLGKRQIEQLVHRIGGCQGRCPAQAKARAQRQRRRDIDRQRRRRQHLNDLHYGRELDRFPIKNDRCRRCRTNAASGTLGHRETHAERVHAGRIIVCDDLEDT